MKKSNLARRVLGAMLGILMLTSLLTACDNAGNVTSTEAAKAMTITLTMIKEEGMTKDGMLLVQDAINEITENRYNTHVVLQMFTAEEYAEKVIGYCRKNEIDLSSPAAAEMSIREFDREVLNFNEWCACDLDDYIGDIIAAIGMTVEAD